MLSGWHEHADFVPILFVVAGIGALSFVQDGEYRIPLRSYVAGIGQGGPGSINVTTAGREGRATSCCTPASC